MSLNTTPGTFVAASVLVATAALGGATIRLSATGTIVDIIVDVTAVQYDHNHDDRYYTKTEINTALQATSTLKLDAADFRLASGTPVWVSGMGNWTSSLELSPFDAVAEVRLMDARITYTGGSALPVIP